MAGLVAAMQKLSVGEAADLAASVKADGPIKSGLADKVLELAKLCEEKVCLGYTHPQATYTHAHTTHAHLP